MMKKLWHNYYSTRITTRDNGNVQSPDKEQSKLDSNINVNSSAHTLTHDKTIRIPFNENNEQLLKANKILVENVQWCQCNVPIQRWFISHY